MRIINFINKILYPTRYSSDAYIKHMKKIGVKIGGGVIYLNPNQ